MSRAKKRDRSMEMLIVIVIIVVALIVHHNNQSNQAYHGQGTNRQSRMMYKNPPGR